MQFAKSLFLYCALILWVCVVVSAQQAATSSTTTVVPRLVNFSARAIDDQGKPIADVAGITFSIYKDQSGGAPLWMETQNVVADVKGNYTVQLGAMSAQGLPLDLFTSGEARWLGVRVNGGEEEPRVLLLSVPYALKAADAQTLGGLPSSAFVLAGEASASAPQATVSTSNRGKLAAGNTGGADPLTVGGSGTAGRIPLWTTSTNLGNSALFQTGTGTTAKVGLGTTTPGAPLDVHGIINSSAGFNLGGKPFAFGSFINDNAFLGFAGNTTMTGTGNTAIGAFSFVSNTNGFNNTATGFTALQRNTTGCCNTAIGSAALQDDTTGFSNTATGYGALETNSSGNSNTANGVGALGFNTSGYENTASGYDALYSNTGAGDNNAIGYQALYSNTAGSDNNAIGYQALYSNTTASGSDAFGFGALRSSTAAMGNAAFGYQSLYSTTTGGGNTADGPLTLVFNTTGDFNTAVGYQALENNTTGSGLTCVGADCTVSAAALTNATAIGAYAVVGQSNSLVLGGTGVHAVNVGVGTTTPSNVLTIGRGTGHPVSDSWETYSSRRWKTNIHSLENALNKVQQLRGVSYDLKDSGKHEIGVIAEEVGKVVPEVVSYEENGKDARGVDYSRLTALLIEAVKQQQKQIATQRHEIARLSHKVNVLESSLHTGQEMQASLMASKR